MTTVNLLKTERIDVRASTLVTAAVQTLADCRQFVLDESQWQAFQEALDRPVQNKPRLKKLLREPAVLG